MPVHCGGSSGHKIAEAAIRHFLFRKNCCCNLRPRTSDSGNKSTVAALVQTEPTRLLFGVSLTLTKLKHHLEVITNLAVVALVVTAVGVAAKRYIESKGEETGFAS